MGFLQLLAGLGRRRDFHIGVRREFRSSGPSLASASAVSKPADRGSYRFDARSGANSQQGECMSKFNFEISPAYSTRGGASTHNPRALIETQVSFFFLTTSVVLAGAVFWLVWTI
jgi:hypothetical protein